MEIQTFSIVVGTRACNAHCKFCVSHMTGFKNTPSKNSIDMAGLAKACRLAEIGNCTTLLLTGKGEPTLYPDEISAYLQFAGSKFPLIELQTNAIHIGRLAQAFYAGKLNSISTKVDGVPFTESTLLQWKSLGLDTIAISTVGINQNDNKETYLWHRKEDYPCLSTTIAYLHRLGFSVRLCVMMRKGAVDSFDKVFDVIEFAKQAGVEQVTCRPIVSTDKSTEEEAVNKYVEENGLDPKVVNSIYNQIESDLRSTKLMSLMHGASVYDFDGQNICMSNCLTNEGKNSQEIRTLIYYSTGEIAYDWQYKGAILRGPSIR